MNITEKKEGYGYLINWIIHFGDLLLINVFFVSIYFIFQQDEILLNNLHYREKVIAFLLINLSYFLVSSFIQFRISFNVIHIEKIVQHSSAFIALYAIFVTAGFSILHIISIPILPWIIGFFILGTLLIGWHILFRTLLKSYRKKGYNYRQVIIVGSGSSALKTHESLIFSEYGYRILGFFDNNINNEQTLPNKYLGKISEIEEYAKKENIDEIFCTLSGNQEEIISELALFSERNMIRFHLVPDFYRFFKRRFTLHFIEATPILSLRYEPLQHFSNRFVKRSFDIIFSGLVLITIFPIIYLIFGSIIKWTSPGPVFFKQKRTGIKGQDFYCYKFRSMQMNKQANTRQATQDDPRITKIGAFMRKTSIDELPQFINVLLNDMSVVGPRPHMLQHTELYSSIIDKYMVRHLVKPGITGWAQVNGCRGETKTVEEMEERVRRDVWYLENWTFFLDLKIIYLTVRNAIRGEENAY